MVVADTKECVSKAVKEINALLTKIILYTLFRSFSLSEIVEYPILPSAFDIADKDGTTLTMTGKTDNP